MSGISSGHESLINDAIASIKDELSAAIDGLGDTVKNSVDLTGCTLFYEAGTTTTIAAIDNVNGVEVPLLNWSTYAGNYGQLSIAGNFMSPKNGNAGTLTGSLTNLKIPAGVTVAFVSNNAACPVSGGYRLL